MSKKMEHYRRYCKSTKAPFSSLSCKILTDSFWGFLFSLTFPILFIKRYYPFQLCCVTKICIHFLSFWRIFVQNHISLKFDIFWSDENNCNGVWQNVVTFNSYTYIIQVITWVICINILGYITLYEITKK